MNLQLETGGATIRHFAPWLVLDLGRMRRVLSFAPYRPGLTTARHILWRQVRDADLGPDMDALDWLAAEMRRIGHGRDVGMMTSRGLAHVQQRRCGLVLCLATVGLGNAERIGQHRHVSSQDYGTINIALVIDQGLTEAAMFETLTIAAEARTTAILEAGLILPSGDRATGTGTDCIALACDRGAVTFAGLHTDLGRAVGRAVHDAVRQGADEWIGKYGNCLP